MWGGGGGGHLFGASPSLVVPLNDVKSLGALFFAPHSLPLCTFPLLFTSTLLWNQQLEAVVCVWVYIRPDPPQSPTPLWRGGSGFHKGRQGQSKAGKYAWFQRKWLCYFSCHQFRWCAVAHRSFINCTVLRNVAPVVSAEGFVV